MLQPTTWRGPWRAKANKGQANNTAKLRFTCLYELLPSCPGVLSVNTSPQLAINSSPASALELRSQQDCSNLCSTQLSWKLPPRQNSGPMLNSTFTLTLDCSHFNLHFSQAAATYTSLYPAFASARGHNNQGMLLTFDQRLADQSTS